jgi:hypothetical protein
MTKEEKLNAFVEKSKQNEDVLAVIVFGSYVRGDGRPDSDIDLVIILRDGFKRAAEYLEDQAFEIIYTTEKAAIEYWQSHKADGVGLWNVGKILYDRDGTGERLRQYGQSLCTELPSQLDESQVVHARFDFEDSLKAINSIKGHDAATASLLVHKKVADSIEVFFGLKRTWSPAPKQQLQTIREQDLVLAGFLDRFYTETNLDGKINLANNISAHIFGMK